VPSPALQDHVLPGRSAVVATLVRLAEQAAEGHGGALTVVGEPGIGKTAVLANAAELIAADVPGVRLIRIEGVEAEVELAWSGLAALLDGLLSGIPNLAPARAAAVRAALAIEGGDEPVEPFAIALAARDLLVQAAEQAPVVVMVDDLPWIDAPTRQTLSYIARRLQFERVAVVSARRSGTDSSSDTGPTYRLDAVDEEVGDRILADSGVHSADVRRQLLAAGGGIPLVLVEAANLLDVDQKAGRTELPDPLPIGPSGQKVVDFVFARLPQPVLGALLVAAAEPDGDLGRIVGALGTQGLGVAELEDAEESGIVQLDGDRLTFRHPLMRSAAYHDAPRADRRAAHRALADTLPEGSQARAWHLGRAAVGPDEDVARSLDVAAELSARRGAPTVAARSWELASRLSPRAGDRARRLGLAAGALLDAGMASAAGRLLDRADAVFDDEAGMDDVIERVLRLRLRSRLPPSAGGRSSSVAELRAAAREVSSVAPDLAVDLLLDALAAYMIAGALADMTSAVDEAIVLRPHVDDERARRIDVLTGARMLVRGQLEGEALLDRYRELGGFDQTGADAVFLAEVVAPVLGFLRPGDAVDELLAELERDLRARGAVRPLVSVLGARSMAKYSRAFPATVSAGTEAIVLAETNGFPELASFAAGVLALCSAVVGDHELCNRAATLLSDVPEPERRALGPVGRGYLAFTEGRFDDADVHFRKVLEMTPIGRGLIRWETEWIEGLIKAGRRDEARDVMDELEGTVPQPLLALHGLDRARGMLATDDATAIRHFEAAIEIAIAHGNRFTEGRGRLALGEWLRRVRRRGEARRQLEEAVELLRGVGATAFAERAVTELRAAGGVVGDDVASHQLLTPHELQVARLVVGGASNRDLAATLFISPRTVEAHLTSIFRKLGVRNRRELQARAFDDPILKP
jgi:DNA-binding CsgD family transcriptional regulator/tetratricopeptide (TPR) repeat protein